MTNALKSSALLLALVPTLTACNDLPEESYIEYPRMLGIKAEVVASPLRELTPQDPRPFAEALPFETLALKEWVVSPEGPLDPKTLGGRWIACELLPSTGTSDCLRGYIRDKDPVLQRIELCPTPSGDADALPGAGSNPNAEAPPARNPPCFLNPAQDPALFTMPVSINMLLGSAMEFWYIASLPGKGPGNSTCISELLEGKSDLNDNCIYGVTSVKIGPVDQLGELLTEMGLDPSSAGGAKTEPEGASNQQPDPVQPGLPGLPPQEGDRHPRITSIYYTIENDGVPITASQQLMPGQPIRAPLESTVKLELTLPKAELQTFPIPINDGEEIELRTEEYESNWYYSWGSLDAASDKGELAIERWNLTPNKEQGQEARSAGQEVFTYFVVRDDRGGIDWRSFRVQLTPAATQSSIYSPSLVPGI